MNRMRNVGSVAEHTRIETEIGHILATEEELMPSSGFAASVMERVRQESALPAPPPFPWMKVIVLLLLVAGICGWGAFEMVRLGMPISGRVAMSWLTIPRQHSENFVRSLNEAGLVALALGTSLVCWLLSRRLAGRGGLL